MGTRASINQTSSLWSVLVSRGHKNIKQPNQFTLVGSCVPQMTQGLGIEDRKAGESVSFSFSFLSPLVSLNYCRLTTSPAMRCDMAFDHPPIVLEPSEVPSIPSVEQPSSLSSPTLPSLILRLVSNWIGVLHNSNSKYFIPSQHQLCQRV